MRLGALLNDAQYCGRSPTSVGGGDCAEGNWLPNTRSCGPGSVTLAGFLALIAPCGGSSGLPKEAAAAAVADIATPAAAVGRTSRLEIMAFSFHVDREHLVDDAIDLHGCLVRSFFWASALSRRTCPAKRGRSF